MLRPFAVVVAITLPSLARDREMCYGEPRYNLCTGTSIPVLGASGPGHVLGPEAAQSLLPFAVLLKEKQSRQKYPKTACGFMVGSGSWAGDGEGRGVGRGTIQQKWARFAASGAGARPSPYPRLTHPKKSK